MTGASVATIPTILVFLLLQRYIIRGIVRAGMSAGRRRRAERRVPEAHAP